MKKSELVKIIREEYENVINEADLGAVKLPSNLNTYLDKFIAVIKKATSLSKMQRLSVVYHIIQGLEIDIADLSTMYSKIKTQMNAMPTEGKKRLGKTLKEDVTKEFDNTVVSYQKLLKQKQDKIQAMRDALTKLTDPKKKQDAIKKHNADIKELNKQINKAEGKFISAVDKVEAANEDDLL